MKKLLILTLLLFITPTLVNAETNYLYDVLKNEVESGGLAREYTREHQDTVDNSGTDKIYHYYANIALKFSNILYRIRILKKSHFLKNSKENLIHYL